MTEDAPTRPTLWQEWRRPLGLLFLTFLSTFYVGAGSARSALAKHWPHEALKWSLLDKPVEGMAHLSLPPLSLEELTYYATHLDVFLAGWTFAVPLMLILIAHEMGHYVAGRIHGVDISPPFFIPMPIFLLGTMGAVIKMRGRIETRNALLDIGAAGPLAGMVVALPVVIYGLMISRVGTLQEFLPPTALAMEPNVFVEGRGVLYLGLIYLLKGPLASDQDVWLSPWALAGWAGLLVTMINMIPIAQLDGGHVAYALFGKRQDTYSRRVHWALPFIGGLVSLAYVLPAYLAGERGIEALSGEAMAGFHWVFWGAVLVVLVRLSGAEHPPTGPEPLSRGRKIVAIGTLALFALLFMPSWIYVP
ncbi:MAG: site-2 protease family protein [Sandaracinaceae bacterium]|nr:site-2 protease family protein [Sandaracinaceae bacterium]